MGHFRAGNGPYRQYPDGTPVTRYISQRAPASSSGRRAFSTGRCIFLLSVGAVFRFALPGGSHLGVNLHVVGVIVICAGLLGLILPRLPGAPVIKDRLRRWVVPSGSGGFRGDPDCGYQGREAYGQPMVGDLSAEPGRPTLADDLLSAEKDPPL